MPRIYFDFPNGTHGSASYQEQRRIIDGNGKEWRFEWQPYCGPWPLRKDGEPFANAPSESSPFWPAVEAWSREGKRVGEDGLCVWGSPTFAEMNTEEKLASALSLLQQVEWAGESMGPACPICEAPAHREKHEPGCAIAEALACSPSRAD